MLKSSPFKWLLVALAYLAGSCAQQSDGPDEDRVIISIWTRWSGFEKDVLDEIIKDFEQEQAGIKVQMFTMGTPQKIMLATAGGNPPDLAILSGPYIASYAENNALTPLDTMVAKAGIEQDDYYPVFWDAATHRGHLWALPISAGVTALHYNKKMFREAGLDPDRPPRTIAELEEYNEKLLKRDAQGRITQMGFLPDKPDWWVQYYGYWFGGKIWDGESQLTLSDEANLNSLHWLASYPERFGADTLENFRAGLGSPASAQNPFFTEQVAMTIQGVFLSNFLEHYLPDDTSLEWAIAPFPSATEDGPPMGLAEGDLCVMPAGAKHPEEAFAFLAYLQRPEVMEKLALGHRKLTPIKEVSASFTEEHPHPYIKDYLALLKSPNLRPHVQLVNANELRNAMRDMFYGVYSGRSEPGAMVERIEPLQQKILDRKLSRWERVEAARLKEWSEQ